MKKLLLLTCIIPVITFAQTLSSYKASNGRYYHVGDDITLGKGTLPNGDYKAILMSGAQNNAAVSGSVSERSNLPARYANTTVKLKAILPVNSHSKDVYFVVGGWNMLSYNIYIEEAIQTCEITECNR